MLKLDWGMCTLQVKVFLKTTQKPSHGSEKQLSKETPMLKLTWELCTKTVKALLKTTQKPNRGF